jgi:hypothetical protein
MTLAKGTAVILVDENPGVMHVPGLVCPPDWTRYQRSASARMATGLPLLRLTRLADFPSGSVFMGAAPFGYLILPERASGIESGDWFCRGRGQSSDIGLWRGLRLANINLVCGDPILFHLAL